MQDAASKLGGELEGQRMIWRLWFAAEWIERGFQQSFPQCEVTADRSARRAAVDRLRTYKRCLMLAIIFPVKATSFTRIQVVRTVKRFLGFAFGFSGAGW